VEKVWNIFYLVVYNVLLGGTVTQPEPEEASQEAAAGVGLLPDNSNSSDDESL
jgi:hypothetical protein